MMKRLLVVVLGLAALVLNPFFGCGNETFRYGADEMRVAIEGTWKLTMPAAGTQPAREILLSISQAAEPTQHHSRRSGMVSDAAACAQRSLIKSAAACVDSSEMPLDVKLLAGDGPAKGMFRVHGLTFTSGRLQLELGTASVDARVASNGTISDIYADGQRAAASMVRVSTAQR